LLVSWCAGDRCDMAGSNEDHCRRRRPGVEDQGSLSTGRVLGGWMVERSGDALCGLHYAQGYECMFLGLASKPREMVSPDLASKPMASGFPVWALKPAAIVGDLGLKITTTVSWFWPQNQVDYGLSVAPQNHLEDDNSVGHVS
jgi:hypothetical protein